MKIYLDDERKAPDGWTQCRWPDEVIELLKTQKVEVVSLDHDLGDFGRTHDRTGYDVLLWLEEQVATQGFVPPKIIIHTSNPAARQRMAQAARRIILYSQGVQGKHE